MFDSFLYVNLKIMLSVAVLCQLLSPRSVWILSFSIIMFLTGVWTNKIILQITNISNRLINQSYSINGFKELVKYILIEPPELLNTHGIR